MIVDEGLVITDGVLAGLNKPAALIGIAEKGYLSVVLKFNTAPGHSSQPPAWHQCHRHDERGIEATRRQPVARRHPRRRLRKCLTRSRRK